ncbi:uncharacterized protein LOC109715837 [Ananas comosus]|uniref:Uncharacterized protein LOC109715837 n=2 Tax=Ananas comosus TaxID=4615 RepID=A0A199W2J0_ANACO|nr:uncharacterized protein LOC109715837 [Ananas comosus]OAY83120.1 hypothetical protein ACMD2_17013 [Ananas comosus]CAD1818784.1 unnamed protein product [Ananas comosus var. bracteatus]
MRRSFAAPSPPLRTAMNHVRAALLGARAAPPQPPLFAAAALFHSTPVLERKRRTQWHYRFNYYAKRRRNKESKTTLLRNISDYAEYLFQSWRDEEEHNESHGPSWFRGHYWVRGTNKNGLHSNKGNYGNNGKIRLEFCSSDDDDDSDVETIFRSTFGGQRYSYWSFDSSENFGWRSSSNRAYHESSSRDWRYETDEETDASTHSELASARQALGMSVCGPLKLEDVKSAYRACALKWHPDRHNGSSKVAAEEKFKHCSAAYKTLCDRLATS